jgi:hypothetical protein
MRETTTNLSVTKIWIQVIDIIIYLLSPLPLSFWIFTLPHTLRALLTVILSILTLVLFDWL